jgi:hypothetical protein
VVPEQDGVVHSWTLPGIEHSFEMRDESGPTQFEMTAGEQTAGRQQKEVREVGSVHERFVLDDKMQTRPAGDRSLRLPVRAAKQRPTQAMLEARKLTPDRLQERPEVGQRLTLAGTKLNLGSSAVVTSIFWWSVSNARPNAAASAR